ncbi:MAG: hypothetical protein FJ317_03370 [SAR202 cluster bacterium]|nr:hypothetical protein [SAR202 cluster bacterium]
MDTVKKYMWIVVAGFAAVFLAIGGYLVYAGFEARAEVKAMLVEEQVYAGAGTEAWGVVPGTLVDNAVTARAQANLIKEHTLGRYGPWGTIPREDTATRQTFVNGVALRSALGLAEMGFGVALMAIAVGGMAILMGVALGGAAVFAAVWARQAATKKAPAMRPAKPAYAGAAT